MLVRQGQAWAHRAPRRRVDPSTKASLTPKEIEKTVSGAKRKPFLDYAWKKRGKDTHGRPVAVMSLAVPTNSTAMSTKMLDTE